MTAKLAFTLVMAALTTCYLLGIYIENIQIMSRGKSLFATALHEAGHAFVALRLKSTIRINKIVIRDDYSGCVQLVSNSLYDGLDFEVIKFLLAGMIVDIQFSGKSASSQLARCKTDLALINDRLVEIQRGRNSFSKHPVLYPRKDANDHFATSGAYKALCPILGDDTWVISPIWNQLYKDIYNGKSDIFSLACLICRGNGFSKILWSKCESLN